MYLFQVKFSSDICLGMGLLDHMIALVFDFEEPPHCSLEWLCQFIFPPTV